MQHGNCTLLYTSDLSPDTFSPHFINSRLHNQPKNGLMFGFGLVVFQKVNMATLGTVQAQRADNSYIGLIAEGRAIGIAFLDEVGAAERPELQDGVVVYLYNRQDLAMMIGETDAEGAATLVSGELSDFDAATGVGGVYWAHDSDEHADIRCDWVVLPDGRQWGCVCVMPPMMPEHPCCQMLLT
jgi:hypothetical protein